jgi:peptide/nickel transport system permease protein
MWRYIASRFLALIPVMLLVTTAAFAFIRLLPGDPVIAMLGTSGQGLDAAAYARARHDLGLDRPVPVQYVHWLGDLARGDFGNSAITHQPVTEALRGRFPVTLQLAISSFIVSLVIAIPTGVVSAYRRGSLFDRLLSVFALAGVAMPSFWLGILLIILFAVELSLLPPSGFVSITTSPVNFLRYMTLPAVTLGMVQAAVIMRQVRSSLLEVLNEDFVRTARAKGLTERRVVLFHGLRNALLPVVTVMGLQVSRLLGGSVVVETVFAMPGLGRYGVDAIFIRDYPVVQIVVLVTALIVVFSNLVTDLLYAALDPRIKFA